jgi:penicillin-binding protein 1C
MQGFRGGGFQLLSPDGTPEHSIHQHVNPAGSLESRGTRKIRGTGRTALFLLPVLLSAWFLLCVPNPLFPDSCSTVIESSSGQLIGARTASDGQWRFPSPDSIPYRFETCLLEFEDRWFYSHPGINPFSLFRAVIQNGRSGRIVCGGSTLTMQVARLARPERKRNIVSKLTEMIWALNLELRFTKREILSMYVGHAPFGGNLVGMEAASWRYFQRPPRLLSWAESATLAVLPNAPSLIYPGRNNDLLTAKRNRLLDKLCRKGIIDSLTSELSKMEPVPSGFFRMPDLSRHLMDLTASEFPGKRIRTTLDEKLQEQVNLAVLKHGKWLSSNHIHNCCALVAETGTGKVLAYTGNIPDYTDTLHGNHVDIIRSERSSGSILKPFLYAFMINRGMLAPNQLVPDIPTRFNRFTPVNFSHDYDGAVPAAQALARSLNIPAVKMLQQVGVEPFYYFLRETGMTTLSQPPGHYGLSLILGGAEVTLWDLAGMYASLARIVRNYSENDGFYPLNQFRPLMWKNQPAPDPGPEAAQPSLRASAAYLTINALLEVNRPGEETGWESFAGSRKIAWKTGTSFGFRDGWAVGITPSHVVAIWAGNADGEGRPGLTGSLCAAPLMFEIFGFLPQGAWFREPSDELIPVAFCKQSGFLPSPYCCDLDTLRVPSGIRIETCPYHTLVHLDRTKKYRVSNDCYPLAEMKSESWFVLPPAMEYYYKQKHPGYAPLPEIKPGCKCREKVMELIYPGEMDRIFVPRQLDNSPGEAVFELAHCQPNVEIFWYIDRKFAGKTTAFHKMSLKPDSGWHLLTVVDQNGNQLQKKFLIIDK